MSEAEDLKIKPEDLQPPKMVAIKDIKPYERNPRYISSTDFEKLKRSLQEDPEMLALRPLILSRKDGKTIIAGNQRYHAAKALGWTSIPATVSKMSDEKERRFIIKDNVSNGDWEYEILMQDYTKDELDDWGWEDDREDPEEDLGDYEEDEKEIIEDLPPDVEPNPVSKPGEVYRLGEHVLVCGSSTDEALLDQAMKLVDIPGDDDPRISMIFTDPPYGVDYKSQAHGSIKNDALGRSGTYQLHVDAFSNAARYTKRTAAIYVWHASRYQRDIEDALEAAGIVVKQQLIWSKGFNLGRDDHHWAHEPCFYCHFKDGRAAWYGGRNKRTVLDYSVKEMNALPKEQLVKMLKAIQNESTVWAIQKDSVATYLHPTQKPVELSARAMANSSRAGELVADFFAGSGSTLIGAEQMGRHCLAFELDPKFADVIRRRWYRFTKGLLKDEDDTGWEEATPVINKEA